MASQKVALFATCLVDMFRPEVGFAAARLIERGGFEVEVPKRQTCCGQPLISSGASASAAKVARGFLRTFEPYDYVVAPSGSCVATVKLRFAELFDSPADIERAESLASRCFELTDFLARFGNDVVEARHQGRCVYHDSCSGLRELGIHDQPRNLLAQVDGLSLSELGDPAACCGFGGAFCVKYPEISASIAEDKAADVERSQASCLLGGDLGCLMNIAGTLRRRGSDVKVLHVAEILAGRGGAPGIGAPRR